MAERVVPVRENYPNNSERAKNELRKQKPSQESSENISEMPKKVIKGKIIKRKKTIGRRFAEAFGAREGQGVFDYILYDIIIPATQEMLVDSIIDGAQMAILGEVRGRRRRDNSYGRSRPYAYDQVSYRDNRRYERGVDRRDRCDSKDRAGLRDYEDIVFEKNDAEDIISGLIDLIESYGQATVGDLYSLAGVTPEYTVGGFGWTNLSRATVRRVRDGYVLDLPRPIAL